MYLSFLYPNIESQVLTALYVIARGAPPKAPNNSGAIIPSDVFSATVSITALIIPSSSRTLVSLPTMYDSCFLAPSISPDSKTLITFNPSTFNPLEDIQKYNNIPSIIIPNILLILKASLTINELTKKVINITPNHVTNTQWLRSIHDP